MVRHIDGKIIVPVPVTTKTTDRQYNLLLNTVRIIQYILKKKIHNRNTNQELKIAVVALTLVSKGANNQRLGEALIND
jgi:hypothetical protein